MKLSLIISFIWIKCFFIASFNNIFKLRLLDLDDDLSMNLYFVIQNIGQCGILSTPIPNVRHAHSINKFVDSSDSLFSKSLARLFHSYTRSHTLIKILFAQEKIRLFSWFSRGFWNVGQISLHMYEDIGDYRYRKWVNRRKREILRKYSQKAAASISNGE